MTSLQFYLLFVLVPNVGIFLTLFCVILALGGVFYLISLSDEKESPDTDKKIVKGVVWSCSWIIGAIALLILVPTKKEMGGMVGVPYLTHVKNADKVPSAVVNKLLEVLKEEQPEKKHDKN